MGSTQSLSEQLAKAEAQIQAWSEKMECGEYADGQYYISGRRASDLSNLNYWKNQLATLVFDRASNS